MLFEEQRQLAEKEVHVQELQNRLDGVVYAITQEPMHDPVIDHEGNTYERAAVMRWLANNMTYFSYHPLSVEQLAPNHALREATDVPEPEPVKQASPSTHLIKPGCHTLARLWSPCPSCWSVIRPSQRKWNHVGGAWDMDHYSLR